MKKRFAFFLLFIFYASSVMAREVLIYTAHPEYAPMSWLENKKLIGIGPEIVETIFAEIGVPVKSLYFPWSRAFEEARQSNIDVIAGLYFTKEREKFLIYSDTHFSESKVVLITRKGHEFEFNQWQDLIGYRGGAVLGDSWGEKLDRYIKSHLNVSYVYTFKQNLMKLLHGRIDYIIATERNARIVSNKFEFSKRITILPVAVATEKEFIAFSATSPFIEYLPQFNAKLKKMVDSGEVERMKEKYIKQAWLSEN